MTSDAAYIHPWLALARTFIGTTEIPGAQHNAKIVQWWIDIRATIRDDETAYCAAFVGAMLERVGVRSSRSAAARSYLKWGTLIEPPAVGAIVIYSRPGCSWCGHVGFAVGRDKAGNIMTLGANQKNTVSIAPFAPARVLGYRYPTEYLSRLDHATALPLLASDGSLSTNEA